MSDTKECWVCCEPTEHLTPCNHLVCESCYSQVPTCPMCRAPLGNGSIEEGSSEEEENSDLTSMSLTRECLKQPSWSFRYCSSNVIQRGKIIITQD